jgi:acyl CoA:acetate/3-ketoacid CoA transferase alpha subunit
MNLTNAVERYQDGLSIEVSGFGKRTTPIWLDNEIDGFGLKSDAQSKNSL